MVKNVYRKGRAAEYAAMKDLRLNDYQVIRSAGSKSPADLLAWDINHFRFIQVKNYKRYNSTVYANWVKELTEFKRTVPENAKVELWLYKRGKFDKIVI